jgi:hypothetical protein
LAFSHWPLAISFFAQQNGNRSRWSLNGKEWQSLVSLAEWQKRHPLSSRKTALPFNAIKG